MLQVLRDHPHTAGSVPLDSEFHKDLSWFKDYLAQCNGIFMIQPSSKPHQVINADASLSGGGAIYKNNCYHTTFPDFIMEQGLSICHKEMLNCLISIKLWAHLLADTTITLYCDSMVTINVLTSARGRDQFLIKAAREIWLASARHNIYIIPVHKPGCLMEGGADALSRFHTSDKYKRQCLTLIAENNLTVWEVDPYLFKMQENL